MRSVAGSMLLAHHAKRDELLAQNVDDRGRDRAQRWSWDATVKPDEIERRLQARHAVNWADRSRHGHQPPLQAASFFHAPGPYELEEVDAQLGGQPGEREDCAMHAKRRRVEQCRRSPARTVKPGFALAR